MPSIDLTFLTRLAHLNARDPALRDKSLEALGRADAGRGVAFLLEALNDDRARVAIYALRRSLLKLPEEQALALLEKADSRKITVLKEIVRLVGELSGEQAYYFLKRYAASENLHPDVQIALLRACWNHLDHDEVWSAFFQAAKSERSALVRATIRIPQQGLSVKNREKLVQLITLLLHHPDAQIRRETLERLVLLPPGQSDEKLHAVLAGLLEDVDPQIRFLAARAMLVDCRARHDTRLTDVFSSERQARSLISIVDAYALEARVNARSLQSSARQLCNALLTRRWQTATAVRLALLVLPQAEIQSFLERLEQAGLLHPDAVHVAVDNWTHILNSHPMPALEALQSWLGSSTRPGLRRIGLGLLCVLAQRQGWIKPMRDQVYHYRQDQELWISDAAEQIELPPVLDTGEKK